MKKIAYIIFVFSVFVIGCKKNNDQKILYFEHIKDIVLPIEDSLYNVVYDYQYIDTDSGEFLIIYLNNKELLFYSIDDLGVKSKINLGEAPLLTFEYINKDSIFVFFNPAYNKYYMHDSSLFLINCKGDKIKNYSWKGAPVWSRENPLYSVDKVGYSDLLFQRLPYSANMIFMNFNIYQNDYFFDSTYLFNNKIPLVGYFDTKENVFHSIDIYKYPKLEKTIKYPYDFSRTYLSISQKGELLIGFAYTSVIYLYNPKNNQITERKITSKIIDTINLNLPNKKRINKYTYLIYDNITDCYYRFVKLDENTYGKGYNYVVLSDSNFNYVGEGFFPVGNSPRFMNYGDNIITYNYMETFANAGKLVFSVYRPVLKTGDVIGIKNKIYNQLDSIKKCYVSENISKGNNNIKKFITKIGFKEDSFLVIILPMNSCSSCLDKAFEFIFLNSKAIFERNIKLIISGKNTAQIQQLLKENNLLLYNKNIFIDSLEKYYNYNIFKIINPRIVIFENKEVTFDTVYVPDKMLNFMMKIKDYVEN